MEKIKGKIVKALSGASIEEQVLLLRELSQNLPVNGTSSNNLIELICELYEITTDEADKKSSGYESFKKPDNYPRHNWLSLQLVDIAFMMQFDGKTWEQKSWVKLCILFLNKEFVSEHEDLEVARLMVIQDAFEGLRPMFVEYGLVSN